MVIRFACPEGHPLTASEDLIGKAGKCPKCSAKFLVPDPREEESPAAPAESGSDSTADVSPASVAKQADDDIIVFLCPEGHKLNGPRRMQGQAGQCPHCGSKFRIPSYDDDEEEEAPAPEPAAADITAMPTGSMLDSSQLEGEITEEVEELSDEIVEVVDDLADLSDSHLPLPNPLPPPVPGESPLAPVFTHLWRRRNRDTPVTVYLSKGEVLEPNRFSPALSQREHAVFAVDDEDLSFRLTVVAWSDISRVDFSRVEELPDGLFE